MSMTHVKRALVNFHHHLSHHHLKSKKLTHLAIGTGLRAKALPTAARMKELAHLSTSVSMASASPWMWDLTSRTTHARATVLPACRMLTAVHTNSALISLTTLPLAPWTSARSSKLSSRATPQSRKIATGTVSLALQTRTAVKTRRICPTATCASKSTASQSDATFRVKKAQRTSFSEHYAPYYHSLLNSI